MRRILPFFLVLLSGGDIFSQSVALLPIEDGRVSRRLVQRAGETLARAVEEETALKRVPARKVRATLEKELRKILNQEIDRARDLFYQFQFREGRRLLEGRGDSQAVLLKALIAMTEGDQKGVLELIRLLQVEPHLKISAKDYPPRLVALFDEVKRKERQDLNVPLVLKFAKGVILDEKFPVGWHDRLSRLVREAHWNHLLVFRLEPIGWNYKLTVSLFSDPPLENRVPLEAVELIDLQNLDEASKIIVKSVFSVDTPRRLH